MLTSVQFTSSSGDLLLIPMQNAMSGYSILDIEGLGPVKATLVSSSFAGREGEQYQSSRREKRNLVFRLGLEAAYSLTSVADLRRRLYPFFMPKLPVTMRFNMDDGPALDIVGRVESMEPAIFSKEPAIDISVVCFDPDFFNANQSYFGGNSTPGSDWLNLNYNGTVDTGVILYLNVNRPITAFTLYHQPADGTIRTMDVSVPIGAGNTLVLQTVPGDKFISINLNTSVLWAVSPQSSWLTLQPGNNQIRLYVPGAAIPYDILWNDRYGGV